MGAQPKLHRFTDGNRRFALDPDTCFCFECDEICWEVIGLYPHTPVNRIYHLLEGRHPRKELEEVIGELEWLRTTKSIAQTPRQEELIRRYELETGLAGMTVMIADTPASGGQAAAPPPATSGWRLWGRGDARSFQPSAGDGGAVLEAAGGLLLARSEKRTELSLEVLFENADTAHARAAETVRVLSGLMRGAALAGKQLVVTAGVNSLSTAGMAAPLDGHHVRAALECRTAEGLGLVQSFLERRPARLAQAIAAFPEGDAAVRGKVTVRPGGADFGGVVKCLEEAGTAWIDFDLDGAFAADPALDAARVMESLRKNAAYYAERLLKGKFFRVEPFAGLFLRIYHGTAKFRNDPAGLNALAVDPAGGIHAAPAFAALGGPALGSVLTGTLDTARLRRFEDVGALTTGGCLSCWARGLCGGGSAAVHQALSGDFRTPAPRWCDAQRAWLEGAVAAFNTLSAAGVNFTRMHESLARRPKLSLFTAAKMALQLRATLRPIEEADAELLTRWENWNDAAYFTFDPSGLLLATQYDREMDALHPRGTVQEFIITDRAGKPLGLVNVRPDRLPGVAWLGLYLRREELYTADWLRNSLRTLLRETAKGGQELKILLAPVGPKEDALAGCLEAMGFGGVGLLREALYLHGRYHDVRLMQCDLRSGS